MLIEMLAHARISPTQQNFFPDIDWNASRANKSHISYNKFFFYKK